MQSSGKTGPIKSNPKTIEWGRKRRKAESKDLRTTQRRNAINDASE